jgi:hypothetical protein
MAIRCRTLGLVATAVVLVPWSSAVAQSTDEPFGYAVAGLGDLNGDGVPDLMVGAPGARPRGKEGAGRATVFSGKDGAVLFTYPGQSSQEAVGSAVACPGDLNGDGKPDFLIGAPGFQTPGMGWLGVVRLYSGSDGKLLWEIRGDWEYGTFGKALAVVGDLDGDGLADILVGAPGVEVGGKDDAGLARVISGKDGKTLFTFEGEAEDEQFGATVAPAGDMNGDGKPDLAVGSPLAPMGTVERVGVVRVYSGKDGSLLHRFRGFANATLGASMVPVGDLNGDGKGDLAVGAPLAIWKGVMAAGFVRVYSGADGSDLKTWGGEGRTIWDCFGIGLAVPGDMNGDKVPDLWVAAVGGETVAGELGREKKPAGRIDLVSGKDGTVIRAIRSERFGEGLGMSLAVAGDLNGDGVPDLLAGAGGAGEAGNRDISKAGRARVYSGKDGSVLLTLTPPPEK